MAPIASMHYQRVHNDPLFNSCVYNYLIYLPHFLLARESQLAKSPPTSTGYDLVELRKHAHKRLTQSLPKLT
jgi:hypothetical protein